MNFFDLDIMTRGTGDTEPSQEFPILYGLLTAPKTNPSSKSNGPDIKSSIRRTFSHSDIVVKYEADSSALSTTESDDECSEVENDSGSSCYFDSSDDIKHLKFVVDEDDSFPTSTTFDTEDIEDLRRASRILKRKHDKIISSSCINNNRENSSSIQQQSKVVVVPNQSNNINYKVAHQNLRKKQKRTKIHR